MRITHDILSHTSWIKISSAAERTNWGMLISGHETDYGWTTMFQTHELIQRATAATNTTTVKFIISVGLLTECMCVCICIVQLWWKKNRMSVIERRLLEKAMTFVCGYTLLSGCPHHIQSYVLSRCIYTMIPFHHISLFFPISFHFIRFLSFASNFYPFNSVSCVHTIFKYAVSRAENRRVKSKFLHLVCHALSVLHFI